LSDDGDDHDGDVFVNISISLMNCFQSKINSELANNGVHIYQFPIDDDSVAEVNTSMNAHVPFAVVGSTDFVHVGKKMMRSRQYPWGTVQGTVLNSTRYSFEQYNH
jgi:septin 6/8/11